MGFKGKRTVRPERQTTEGNVQDWLQLDAGEPGFEFLSARHFSSDIFCLFLSALLILLNVQFIFSCVFVF
jgi:hypothetical protein